MTGNRPTLTFSTMTSGPGDTATYLVVTSNTGLFNPGDPAWPAVLKKLWTELAKPSEAASKAIRSIEVRVLAAGNQLWIEVDGQAFDENRGHIVSAVHRWADAMTDSRNPTRVIDDANPAGEPFGVVIISASTMLLQPIDSNGASGRLQIIYIGEASKEISQLVSGIAVQTGLVRATRSSRPAVEDGVLHYELKNPQATPQDHAAFVQSLKVKLDEALTGRGQVAGLCLVEVIEPSDRVDRIKPCVTIVSVRVDGYPCLKIRANFRLINERLLGQRYVRPETARGCLVQWPLLVAELYKAAEVEGVFETLKWVRVATTTTEEWPLIIELSDLAAGNEAALSRAVAQAVQQLLGGRTTVQVEWPAS